MENQDRFWAATWRRAGRAAVESTFAKRDRLLVAVPLFIVYVALVWFWGGKAKAADEILLRLSLTLAPVAIFPFVFLWQFFRAASAIHAEVRAEACTLHDKLTPRLKLAFPQQHGIHQVSTGHVSETGDGRRHVIYRWPQTILRLTCTNLGSMRIAECRAYLIDARLVRDTGTLEDIGFIDPVQLSWSPDLAARELTVSIEPGASHSLYVVTRKGYPALLLYKLTNQMPIEYATLFGEGHRYRLWVQVTGAEEIGDRLCLDVWADERTVVPPPLTILAEVVRDLSCTEASSTEL